MESSLRTRVTSILFNSVSAFCPWRWWRSHPWCSCVSTRLTPYVYARCAAACTVFGIWTSPPCSPTLSHSTLSCFPSIAGDGTFVDPPLCRGTSQGKYGLRIIGLVCEGETGKIGELDGMGERELVLVVSVWCCVIVVFQCRSIPSFQEQEQKLKSTLLQGSVLVLL